MEELLRETRLLNFRNPDLSALVHARGWSDAGNAAAPDIYRFVRDEILLGYPADDEMPASEVLACGYGQCNTKAILLMALLRAAGVPCRLHGALVKKELQKGAATGLVYLLAPKAVVHSWAEIPGPDGWLALEGVILDTPYLSALQSKFAARAENFCGYACAAPDLLHPQIEFSRTVGTYIQAEAVIQDLGIFDTPDAFLKQYTQKLSPLKKRLYASVGAPRMNRNVARIRSRSIRDKE